MSEPGGDLAKRVGASRQRACAWCGTPFVPTWSHRKRGKSGWSECCSNKCATERRHASTRARVSARVERQMEERRRGCPECGTLFLARARTQLTCSDLCRDEREARLQRDRVASAVPFRALECPACHREFLQSHRGQLFCSRKCSRRFHKGASNHRGRARRAGVEYEPVNRISVFLRDGWRCQCCGRSTPRRLLGSVADGAPELDHRVPIARGGAHSYANVQLACRACNLRKGAHEVRGQLPLWDRPG